MNGSHSAYGKTHGVYHSPAYDRLQLRQTRFRHFERVLLPILAVEQFQRQQAAVTAGLQVGDDHLPRGDAVAGVDAVGVIQVGGRGGGGVVVHVEDADRGPADQFQAAEFRSAFVQV